MAEPDTALSVEAVDTVDDAEWEALLARDPAATVLHHPQVSRIVARELGRRARAEWLCVRDDRGRLRGGLGLLWQRRFGVARVASGAAGLYGGPVLDPDVAGPAGALLADRFAGLGGWRTIARELVWSGRTPPAGDWTGLRPLPTAVLEIGAAPEFEAWYVEQLRASRRKERRRLLRRGFGAAPAPGTEFLDAFYPLYVERCADWGTKPLSRGLLAGLLDSDPRWQAFVVHDGDGALAGAHLCVDLGTELFAWLGTTARVEGGATPTLLIEAELRWCHEHGRRLLNLGTSAGLTGVSDFKRLIDAVDDPRWILRWHRGRGFA